MAAGIARELQVPLHLTTAEGGLSFLGPAWGTALLEELRNAFPLLEVTLVADCGEHPGLVLSALRCGVKHIAFHGTPEGSKKLADLCGQQGATLVTAPLSVLDLKALKNPAASCRSWLSGEEPGQEPQG